MMMKKVTIDALICGTFLYVMFAGLTALPFDLFRDYDNQPKHSLVNLDKDHETKDLSGENQEIPAESKPLIRMARELPGMLTPQKIALLNELKELVAKGLGLELSDTKAKVFPNMGPMVEELELGQILENLEIIVRMPEFSPEALENLKRAQPFGAKPEEQVSNQHSNNGESLSLFDDFYKILFHPELNLLQFVVIGIALLLLVGAILLALHIYGKESVAKMIEQQRGLLMSSRLASHRSKQLAIQQEVSRKRKAAMIRKIEENSQKRHQKQKTTSKEQSKSSTGAKSSFEPSHSSMVMLVEANKSVDPVISGGFVRQPSKSPASR